MPILFCSIAHFFRWSIPSLSPKATLANIKQNLFGAVIYNLVAIPLAAGMFFPLFHILLNPLIAAAAMTLASLAVVYNANRLSLCLAHI